MKKVLFFIIVTILLLSCDFKDKSNDKELEATFFKEVLNKNGKDLSKKNQIGRIYINKELSFKLPLGWKLADEEILNNYKAMTKSRTGINSTLKMVVMKQEDFEINYPQITIGIVPYGNVTELVTFEIMKESVQMYFEKTMSVVFKELFSDVIADIKTEELLVNEKNQWVLLKNIIEIPVEGGELENYLAIINSTDGMCRINLTCFPKQKKESFAALKIILNSLEREY